MAVQIKPILHKQFHSVVSAIQSEDTKTLALLLKCEDLHLVDFQNHTVLHIAARCEDPQILQMLLEDRRVMKLLNQQMYNGDTPLLTAARVGNVAAVRILMDHGADVEARRLDSGNNALHFAARNADCDLMNILLSRNTTAKFINTTNVYGDTALEIAMKEKSPTVQLLLQAGADYSGPNTFTGRNLLHTSVAYDQCPFVKELVASENAHKFIDAADNRGDTPLLLAVRLECLECVKTLINFLKPGNEVNRRTGESILHIAVQTNQNKLVKYILMFSQEALIDFQDFEGRTPLLLAIEEEKHNCVDILLRTRNVFAKGGKFKDTPLHTALRVNDNLTLSLLLKSNNQAITWCFSQKNKQGQTPFWVAIEGGHASFIIESRKGGWVNVDELNEFGDSPTFVAAACGHLKVLKALLLSERYYSFCKDHQMDKDLKETELLKSAEICCDIYNSDIFILTNKINKLKFHTWMPKSFLSVNKSTGRNIFHACAIGGNIDCLEFIHTFCSVFAPNQKLFDATDNQGNTPLMLATKNDYGGPSCVYYFLTNGGNISSHNESGETVLKSLLVYTYDSTSLLRSVLDNAITYDITAKGLQEESESLRVDYTLFQPPNQAITKTIKLLFESITGSQRKKLLQHALIGSYVHIINTMITYPLLIRIIVSFLSSFFLAIYLIFYSSVQNEEEDSYYQFLIFHIIRYTLFVINLFGIFLTVPLLFHDHLCVFGILTNILMLLPCVSVMILLILPYNSPLSFDFSAVTVLVSSLSLMMYSTAIFEDISNQISTISHVLYRMMCYFRIVFSILIPFSLVFYCIFNDKTFFFTTPIKSLIYTTFVLIHGDTSESFEYFEQKHFISYKITNESNTTSVRRSRVKSDIDLYLESMFLFIFIISCVLGLMNMMVGLAVRDSKKLSADGEVFRRYLQIYWLNSLEEFQKSFIHRVFRATPLIYLLGVSRKSFDHVKPSVDQMFQKGSFAFPVKSVIEMKKSGRKSKEQPSHNIALQNVRRSVLGTRETLRVRHKLTN
uniref:Ion transport domain-containing protein n=1 Tax=Cuerna arida TaxID=1464854 RepID=A0A1B6EYW4_9HEMI